MENDEYFEQTPDPEHLNALSQGVSAWNQWRLEHPDEYPYLGRVNFNDIKSKISFRVQRRYGAQRDLSGINLSNLVLHDANFSGIKLHGANFDGAILGGAYFFDADVKLSSFSNALFYGTTLVNTDMSNCAGLETCRHEFASYVDHKTLHNSSEIPDDFLKGCGLPDCQIEAAKMYRTDLSNEEIVEIAYRIHDLRANQAIQINPLFISYTHADSDFVDEMEKHLKERGIRFWRDKRDGTSGRLEKQIDRVMHLNPIVLLVLSERAVESDWVEHEAESARELEKKLGRDVLCPVALDQTWETCKWDKKLLRQIRKYGVLDFSEWKDEAVFNRMFTRLLRGLDLFYDKE